MDLTKIVVILDNLLRQLNDLLNKILKNNGKPELTTNKTQF